MIHEARRKHVDHHGDHHLLYRDGRLSVLSHGILAKLRTILRILPEGAEMVAGGKKRRNGSQRSDRSHGSAHKPTYYLRGQRASHPDAYIFFALLAVRSILHENPFSRQSIDDYDELMVCNSIEQTLLRSAKVRTANNQLNFTATSRKIKKPRTFT